MINKTNKLTWIAYFYNTRNVDKTNVPFTNNPKLLPLDYMHISKVKVVDNFNYLNFQKSYTFNIK